MEIFHHTTDCMHVGNLCLLLLWRSLDQVFGVSHVGNLRSAKTSLVADGLSQISIYDAKMFSDFSFCLVGTLGCWDGEKNVDFKITFCLTPLTVF